MTASLSDPLDLVRGPSWANRIMLAPMTNKQSHDDGTLSDEEYRWLMMRAEGGYGLTMTCAAHVQRVGQGFGGQLGVFDDAHIEGLTRLAAGIKAAGSVSAIQLHHAGIRAEKDVVPQPVSASDHAETGGRGLTTAEVEQLRDDFIAAAVRAERAGFDGAEIHGAHGYILAQFLSEETNQRTDAYGGSLENRARLLVEIVNGIRGACGPDFQLGLRLSPERFGLHLGEMRDLVAELLRGNALDYLDMSLWDVFKQAEDLAYAERPLMGWFTDLPRGEVRLGVAGKIASAADAKAVLDAGCDFAIIGKPAIVHPDFARRALADPGFVSDAWPIPASYLATQGVSPVFLKYLDYWKGFVDQDA